MKITITLEEEQIEEVRRMVAAGRADSISGFVKHAVGVALHDAAGWKQMLDEALEKTGGPLTADERTWADSVLSSAKRPARPAGKRRASA